MSLVSTSIFFLAWLWKLCDYCVYLVTSTMHLTDVQNQGKISIDKSTLNSNMLIFEAVVTSVSKVTAYLFGILYYVMGLLKVSVYPKRPSCVNVAALPPRV